MIINWYKIRINPELESTDYLLNKKLDEKTLSNFVSRSHDSSSSIHFKPKNTTDNHQEFNQSIKDDKEYKPDYFDEGYENKLVYNTPNGKFMVKPYNSTLHGMSGLASSVTKKLYDVSGLENNIENVKTHNLQTSLGQIPVNVHKFENDVEPIKSSHKIDPVEANQIYLMDFLTGNPDRHLGNILVKKNPNNKGYNPLFAIDHSLSLNYDSDTDSIQSVQAAHLPKAETNSSNINHMNSVASWWIHHSPKIQGSFIDEINSINNEPVRDGLISNFKNRHKAITDWANQQLDTSIKNKQNIKDIKSKKINTKYVESELENINGSDSAEKLLNVAEKMHAKKYHFNDIKNGIEKHAEDLQFNEIPRDKFSHIMSAFPHNNEGHQARLHLIDNLLSDFSYKKTDFHKHLDRIKLRDILIHDEKQPEGSKHANPYVSNKIKRFLGDTDS